MFRRTAVNLAQSAGKAIPPVKLAYKYMLKDPSKKYKPFKAVTLPNRKWPDNRITKAPRWLSTDLRDGNQSLPDPMSVEQKKEYFHKLVVVSQELLINVFGGKTREQRVMTGIIHCQ